MKLGYLEWFNDQDATKEGDKQGCEPLVGEVVAEHDAVGHQEEDGGEDGGQAENPAHDDAIPEQKW